MNNKLQLVAESKLRGFPFDNLNKLPSRIEDAFFTVYCNDMEWAKQVGLESSGLVSMKGATKGNSGQLARYKLNGEVEKLLRKGVFLQEPLCKFSLEQTEKGEFELIREATDKSRRRIRQQYVSSRAFGADRLFIPITDQKSKFLSYGLAKAAPMNGMDDLLLIRSSRDGDNVWGMLEETGLYKSTRTAQKGDPRFSALNPQGQEGQVCAIYIPSEIAESIRNTPENKVLNFQYGSGDAPALSADAISQMEMTEELVSFTDDEASPEFVCKLAARHWPIQQVVETAQEIARPQEQPKKPVQWLVPLRVLCEGKGLTPDHYRIIRTLQADGDYNYRLQANPVYVPRKGPTSLWEIADPERCKEPLELERDGSDEQLSCLIGTNEAEAKAEIKRFEEALGGPIQQTEVPFKLHEFGLLSKPITISFGESNYRDRAAITHLSLARCEQGGRMQDYLVLQSPHAVRLSEKYLGHLGLRKKMTSLALTATNEIPSLVAVAIAPAVADAIGQQMVASENLKATARDDRAVEDASLEHLKTRLRMAAQVRELKSSDVVAGRPIERPRELAAAKKKAEEKETPLIDQAVNFILKYPESQLMLQKITSGEPTQTHYALYINHKHNGNRQCFGPLNNILGQLLDDEGDPLIELANETKSSEGHAREWQLFCLDPVPEELVDALQNSARPPIETEAMDLSAQDGLQQARDHFRDYKRHRTLAKPEKTIAEKLATKPMGQVYIRYPSAADAQRDHNECKALLSHLDEWSQSPKPDKALRAQALHVMERLKHISPAARHVYEAVNTMQMAASSIEYSRSHASHAQQMLAAEERWMKQHLDENRNVCALIVYDMNHKDADTLFKQGKLTAEPISVGYQKLRSGKNYQKLRSGEKGRRMWAQAQVLYPTQAFWTELEQRRAEAKPDEASIPAFTLLPEWQELLPDTHHNIPVLSIGPQLSECLISHFDIGALNDRERALRKPKEAIAEMAKFILKDMPNQALLVRERQVNKVDGATNARGKATQGVGVDAEEKGSQLVLVAALNSRNVKSFLRQVWRPLEATQLVAGKKIYEAETVEKPRDISAKEQQIHALQQLNEQLNRVAQQFDMDYRSKDHFQQQGKLSPDLIEQLRDELSQSLRIFERLQRSTDDPELQPIYLERRQLHERLSEWAQHPEADTLHADFSPMLIWPALLAHHGLSMESLASGADAMPAFIAAASEFKKLHQSVRRSVGDKEAEAAIDRRDIRTLDKVVKTSQASVALYDLDNRPLINDDGQPLSDEQIAVRAAGGLIVKCYLSSRAEAIAKADSNLLRTLKEELGKQLPAQGRRDVKLEDDDLLQQATGKYTARLESEADLLKQVRYAVTDDHAITPHELKILMGKYFESGQGRGAA